MCDTINWLLKPPIWNEKELKLLTSTPIKKPIKLTINELIEKSARFQIDIPLDSIKTITLKQSVCALKLEENIQSAYPLIHENVLNLCAKYLIFKCENGTSDERKLYANMSVCEFIQRLLDKRAVVFNTNLYVLRNGVQIQDNKWINAIEDYLSYDEIKLSSMLLVSSYSYFINNGGRCNGGTPAENRENIENDGVVVGLSGPKLQTSTLDFQEIIITNTQNCAINGYGNCDIPNVRSLFFNFYEEQSYLYNNVRFAQMDNLTHFKELSSGDFFYNCVYVKRLAVCFDTLLMEANYRAQKCAKFAYLHVVGVGLGIRRIEGHQEDLFVKTFGESIKKLGRNVYHISDVNFSHFHRIVQCLGVNDGDMLPVEGHPKGGVFIHISVREPFEKLKDPDKLLVVSYAADGNALPGNEFWRGSLYSSGHAASASSSQIAELHNPFINETVCANNLMVATINGLLPFSEYIQRINNNNII